MLRPIITVVFSVICSVANAAEPERVYFIRNPEDPVVISSKANSGKGIIMRDPNLGTNESKPAKMLPKERKKTAVSALKLTPKKSALAFKPLRIGATLRMPRVEFGRVALPTSIREELPSTDFIDRSLNEMP